MKLSLTVPVVAAIVIIAFVVSNFLPKYQGNSIGSEKSISPLGAELIVDNDRLIAGETTKLTLKAFIKDFVLPGSSHSEQNNVTMLFNLPEKNLEYVSGDLSWHVDI